MAIVVSLAALAGLGIGLAIGLNRGGPDRNAAGGGAGGSMMGGAGRAGQAMMGGSGLGAMTGMDPGREMGAALADAPGPRISPAAADRLGAAVPPGGRADTSGRRLSFSGREVTLDILASPAGGPDMTFRVAGMVGPTIVVPAGARVRLLLINADADTAHGLWVTGAGAATSAMPMMSAAPAFPDAAVQPLGDPTAAGMHAGTASFTAATAGSYRYICPVPGHALRGMVGTFVVTG